MTEPSDTTTLDHYLRVLRQHRRLIVVVAFICSATALALALNQEPRYEATASMSFKDDSQALGAAGIVVQRSQEPAQVANQAAGTLTRDAIMNVVRKRLREKATVEDLQSRVSAVADPASNLVVITAKARTGKGAAALANTTAIVARDTTNQRAQDAARSEIATVRKRLARLDKGDTVDRRLQQEQLARLEAFSAFSASATINAVAAVPSSPSSPKPVLSTFIGLFLGIIIGVGLAFIRNTLDRRLRRPTEIAATLGLPLLGVVPADKLAIVPRSGVGPEAEGLEGFRILRTNVDFLDFDNPPRTVLVTSAMPEEGKSTVAVGLAVSGAATGRRTLLVECDLRRPVHAERLGLAKTPGLTDFLSGAAQPPDVLQTRPVDLGGDAATARVPGTALDLVCIAAGTQTDRPAEMLVSNRFKDFLAEVSSVYDLVVIDAPPLLPVADTLELVPQVDAVLFCVRSARTTRDQARAGIAALERFPARPTGLVVTDVRMNDGDVGGYYRYDYSSTGSSESAGTISTT